MRCLLILNWSDPLAHQSLFARQRWRHLLRSGTQGFQGSGSSFSTAEMSSSSSSSSSSYVVIITTLVIITTVVIITIMISSAATAWQPPQFTSCTARRVAMFSTLAPAECAQRFCKEKKVDAENPKQVFDFYMFVWKIFYAARMYFQSFPCGFWGKLLFASFSSMP